MMFVDSCDLTLPSTSQITVHSVVEFLLNLFLNKIAESIFSLKIIVKTYILNNILCLANFFGLSDTR